MFTVSTICPITIDEHFFKTQNLIQLNADMSCNCFSSSFLALHFHPISHHKLKPGKQQPWLFTSNTTSRTKRLQLCRPNVFDFIAAVADVPPVTFAPKGDIKVFLKNSVILLVMYFIANFIAPYFISKYFEFDKVTEEDKKPQEKDPSGS